MATGDAADFVSRLRSVIPSRWFPSTPPGAPSNTPVLDAVLGGLAAAWAQVYALLAYTQLQTRISTATDVFLDIIALDFFGRSLQRLTNESDTQFRARIKMNLLRPRGTRAALVKALTDLTGRAPVIFEPANTGDTGGYGHAGMTGGTGLAYGKAGGYGSLMLPFQCFVKAYRPSGQGIANYNGYGGSIGGYGVGRMAYGSTSLVQGQVTDVVIYQTVADTMPCAAIAWTAISN